MEKHDEHDRRWAVLTREAVLGAVRAGRDRGACGMIDGRDYARLLDFFPASDYAAFGFELKDGATPTDPEPWTEESVRERFAVDVAFAFYKALGQRGISASLMNEVVKMWLWVLEDPLQDHDEYAQYGLPLLKKVAVKYNLPNPIGEDYGGEDRYASGY